MATPQNSFTGRRPATGDRRLTRLMEILEDTRATAREQLRAAWELHVARVQEQIEKDWREQIALVLDERFAELADAVGSEVEQRVAERVESQTRAAVEEARATAVRELSELLNHAARRMRAAENDEQLLMVLLDAASKFCSRAALFLVVGNKLVFQRRLGGSDDGLPLMESGTEVPLSSAPAFQTAAETLDTVVAMHVPGELSEAVSAGLPAVSENRVVLLPVTQEGRAVAVLFGEPAGSRPDLNSLELLVTVASAVLDRRTAEVPENLVSITGAEPPAKVPPPAWESLPEEEQELHLRAQRFARVQVAEMRLHKSGIVKEGRRDGDLYVRLKDDIDAAREVFRLDYLARCASMVDYFHFELVRTLTNDDESLLGPEYPGPLA